MSRYELRSIGLFTTLLMFTAMLDHSNAFAEDQPANKEDPFLSTLTKADKDGDGRLSMTEFEELRGASPLTQRDFRLFDQNRDTFLVRDEFATIPDVVAGVERESRIDPILMLRDQIVANLDKAMGKWDEKPDHQFDAGRFQRALAALSGPGLRFRTEFLDEDQNGRISRAEAGRFVEMQLGIRRGDGKLLRQPDGRLFNYILFLHIDENRNDQLERKEFLERSFSPGNADQEFAAANTNGDDHLSFEEFKNVTGRGTFDSIFEFRLWDTNLDASLSKEELLKGTPDWQKKIAENAIPAFDLDRDGQLSLAEYRLTPQANMVLPWDWGMDDKDGDGYLSFAEFHFDPARLPAYEQGQFPLLRFTYFHRFDQNSDGKLDPKEFIYRRKTPDEFFVMNEDGTGWKSLFLFEGHSACGSVAVSPDGKWIAFDSWPGVNQRGSAIFVKELQGGEPRMLCSGMMPTWSKDGRFLTCSRNEPMYGAWIIEVEGEGREHLCPGWGAQWSPDGQQISFDQDATIKVFDIVDDKFHEVLEPQGRTYEQLFWNMAWSPDSRQLCFKGVKPDGTQEVATMSVIDKNPMIKVHHSGKQHVNADFAWHPKGDRIIYAMLCEERSVMQLYEFNPHQNDPPKLVEGQDKTRNNTDVCWTPDGKQLIVVSGDF